MEARAPDYAEKSDDELLRLTVEPEQLTEKARAALSNELRRRHLDSHDRIEEFAKEEKAYHHLHDIDLGPLGLGPHGMGKRLYGKWNREITGTEEEYDATLFAVVGFFPLVPIATYRMSREQGSKE